MHQCLLWAPFDYTPFAPYVILIDLSDFEDRKEQDCTELCQAQLKLAGKGGHSSRDIISPLSEDKITLSIPLETLKTLI